MERHRAYSSDDMRCAVRFVGWDDGCEMKTLKEWARGI
jgi:hypothetical protein